MIFRGLFSHSTPLSDQPIGLETQRGFQEIQELATIGCPDGDALYDTLVTQTEWG